MGIRVFLGGRGAVKLTHHFRVAMRIRINGVVPSFRICIYSVEKSGQLYLYVASRVALRRFPVQISFGNQTILRFPWYSSVHPEQFLG